MATTVCYPVNEPAGLLWEVPDEIAPKVTMRLRLRNLSAEDAFPGVEIPVVRESALRRGRSSIPGVAVVDGFRKRIRFVNPSTGPAIEGTLRVSRMEGGASPNRGRPTLVAEIPISIPGGRWTPWPGGVSVADGAGLPAVDAPLGLLLEFVPADDTRPYWWFATTTSDATNQVTVYSPN